MFLLVWKNPIDWGGYSEKDAGEIESPNIERSEWDNLQTHA